MIATTQPPCRDGAYATQDRAGVGVALRWFRWHRAFVRSSCEHARDPEDRWFHEVMTRGEARRRLASRVLIAINRKCGPDPPWRKLDPLYQVNLARDARAINDYFGRRIVVRECNLATPELRRRYKGLLFEE